MSPRTPRHSSLAEETTGPEDSRHFVTALARGLQVLQCFKSGEEKLGNQELAARCKLPKSTVSRLTFTLTTLGYLYHDASTARYRLGMAALKLGGTTLSRLDAIEVSRPFMQALADRTDSVIALGMRDGMSMLYIETCRSASLITVRLNIGSRIPIARTSMGRTYLAAAKPTARKSIEERLRNLDPTAWPALEADIGRAVTELGEYGCCSSFGDWQREINSIAAPLHLDKRLPMMILSSAGPSALMSSALYMDEIRPALLEAAREIEAQFHKHV